MDNNKQHLSVGLSDLNADDKYKVLHINGKRVQIKKGEDVEVTPIIKDIVKEADEFARLGNKNEKLELEG